MTKEFNNLEELEPYYDEKSNTYVFKEDGVSIDIKLNFNLSTGANINARNIVARDIFCHDINAFDIIACDIVARNIVARDIDAGNIHAGDINAEDIDYYAICVSYNNIICKSIKGRRYNCFHKALDGEIIIKEKGDK